MDSGFLKKHKFEGSTFGFYLTLIIILTLTQIRIVNGAKSTEEDAKMVVDKFQQVFFYGPSQLIQHHRLMKRDIPQRYGRGFSKETAFSINMVSEEKNYKIKFAVDKSIFHPEIVFENSMGPINYDTTRTLSGHLQGERNSVVRGLLSGDGHFNGYVISSGIEYYVEPSQRYLSEANKSHGIMYRTEDMKWYSDSFRSDDNINSYNFPNKKSNEELYEKSVPNIRPKRSAAVSKTQVCTLFVQADYKLFEHFGTESACIDVIVQHVQKANEIFGATDFDSDGTPRDIQFVLKRVKVETQEPTAPKLNFSIPGTVQPLLNFQVNGDYSAFCLAYLFTMENFGQLAGQATPAVSLENGHIVQGICAGARTKEHNGSFYKISSNVGIVTLKNKIAIPPPISHLVFVHELAHNFGSQHDPEDDDLCSPGGEGGNYVMSSEVEFAHKKNKRKFSPCSVNDIRPFLNLAREKPGCLAEIKSLKGICGNGVVEKDEECDCGWEEDCKESCCIPMRNISLENVIPCTLRTQALCSPSQGRCCSENCTLSYGLMCQHINTCMEEAVCDGKSPACPSSGYKSDTVACGKDGRGICINRECYPIKYVCNYFGLELCLCESEFDDISSSHCELCCKQPGVTSPCVSSFKWNNAPFNVPDLYLEPGFPCKNFTGTCDLKHFCRGKTLFLIIQEEIMEKLPLYIPLFLLLVILLILIIWK